MFIKFLVIFTYKYLCDILLIMSTKDAIPRKGFKRISWATRWFILILVLVSIFTGRWLYNQWRLKQEYMISTQPYRDAYTRAKEYMEEGERLQKEFERRQKADTYGGATPEETLTLFVDALKKKDYKLASKYYRFDKQEEVKREMFEWLKNDNADVFVNVYNKNILSKRQLINEVALYIKEDVNEKYPYRMILQLNKQNHIWKIIDF